MAARQCRPLAAGHRRRGLLARIRDCRRTAAADAAVGLVFLEKDPLFMPVSRPRHGNFGVAASGSRLGRLGRPPGSAETVEQRRQPCRTVCTG